MGFKAFGVSGVLGLGSFWGFIRDGVEGRKGSGKIGSRVYGG